MPIPFHCDCGKKLQAKAEFAGKKLRCPGCGKVLTIPAAPAATPPPAPAPAPPPPPARRVAAPTVPPPAEVLGVAETEGAPAPAPPPPLPPARRVAAPPVPTPAEAPGVAETEGAPPRPSPAVVHFVCNCGRRLKARKEDVGESIDCPECGRALVVPPTDTEEPPPAPEPGPAPWVDGLVSQTLTPWPDDAARRRGADGKEPRNEKVGSWLGTLVLLALVAGGVGAWWYFGAEVSAFAAKQEPRPAPPAARADAGLDELELIPADALAFLTVRPGAPGADRFASLRLPLGKRTVGKLVVDLKAPPTQPMPVPGDPVDGPKIQAEPGPDVVHLTLVSLAPASGGPADKGPRAEAPQPEHCLLVRTATPYSRARVWEIVFGPGQPPARGFRTYSVPESPPPVVMGKDQPPPKQGKKGNKGGGQKGKKGPFPPKGNGGGVPQGKIPDVPFPGKEAMGQTATERRAPAVHFLSSHVFLVGDTVSLRRFLQSRLALTTVVPLAPAVKEARAGAGRPLVIGLNQTSNFLEARGPSLPKGVADFMSAVFTVTSAGETELRLELPTPQAAARVAREQKAGARLQRLRSLESARQSTQVVPGVLAVPPALLAAPAGLSLPPALAAAAVQAQVVEPSEEELARRKEVEMRLAELEPLKSDFEKALQVRSKGARVSLTLAPSLVPPPGRELFGEWQAELQAPVLRLALEGRAGRERPAPKAKGPPGFPGKLPKGFPGK
jgi:DNA-directed RNA polymerase subunit RPC12/RpoP